ncbi:MAG TPA: hypothetical protein VJP40_08050 [bacterium]|nr:hypothetical protein [bacterium]
MTSKGLSAPFSAGGLETSAWGATSLRELNSLSGEADSELYAQGLLSLAQRLLRQNRIEPARRLLHHLQQNNPKSSAIAAKAGREIDAIEGRGAVGGRFEFSLNRFGHEALSPALLVGMSAASTVFKVSRAALLGRLLSAPVAGVATRGLGARSLAGAGAFALEAPSFVAATRGAHWALGETSSHASIGSEMAGAYLTLGGLKLLGSAGEQALRLSGGGALARATIPHASAYLGLLAGHGLEHLSGLRKIASGDTWLLDSLLMLAQFRVGGEFSNKLLGPRFAGFQNELSLAAERSAPPSKLPGLRMGSESLALAGPAASRRALAWQSDFADPMRIQGESRKSGFWKSDGSSIPGALNIRWVPEGTPSIRVERSPDPVWTILGALENHLKKIHPSSVEIHYQGRMIQLRDQDKLKERIAKIFESSSIPNGFLTAVAFLEGSPKMALIFIKEKGRMEYKFTGINVPDNYSSSASVAKVASSPAVRTIGRFEDIRIQLPELLQTRNPKISFEGSFGIRDNLALEQLLEKQGLPQDQTFTVVMKNDRVQIVFAWESERGTRKINSKTLPIESSFLNLGSGSALATTTPTPRTPAVTESRERPAEPDRITPTPAETTTPQVHSCSTANQALEKFFELLESGEPSAFLTPIEMRTGRLDDYNLSFIATMLTTHPLPRGRKANLVWVDRPQGLLRIESDENGRTTAELRVFGQGSQNYLLKPNFADGEKMEMRFVRISR